MIAAFQGIKLLIPASAAHEPCDLQVINTLIGDLLLSLTRRALA